MTEETRGVGALSCHAPWKNEAYLLESPGAINFKGHLNGRVAGHRSVPSGATNTQAPIDRRAMVRVRRRRASSRSETPWDNAVSIRWCTLIREMAVPQDLLNLKDDSSKMRYCFAFIRP